MRILALAPLALFATSAVADPVVTAPVAQVAAPSSLPGVTADADFVDKAGNHGVLFKAAGVTAQSVKSKRITWTLLVKRKLGSWETAHNYPIAETAVLSDVSTSLLFVTLARDGFLPGEHEAAIVGTVDEGASEVFRGVTSFVLKPGQLHR